MKVNYKIAFVSAATLAAGLLGGVASAQTPYPHPAGINQRLHDQNARIHQGIGSDQLTRHETYNLRARDARVYSQEERDRYLHGGRLTSRERERLNARLNRDSGAIYRDKHNAFTR